MRPTTCLFIAATLIVCLSSSAEGQYEGPPPPRLLIPGAVPASGGAGGRGRGGGSASGPQQPAAGGGGRRVAVRGRGGVARSRPQPPALPPRPVIELDEEPTTYATPQAAYQPTTFQPPAFRPQPIADLPVPTRQQYSRGSPSEEAAFTRGASRPSPLPAQEESDDSEGDDQGYGTTRARPLQATSQEDTGFARSGDDSGFTRPRPIQAEPPVFQRPAVRPAVQQQAEEQPTYQRARPAQDTYQRPRAQPQVQEENTIRGRNDLKSSYNRGQSRPKPQLQDQPAPAPRQRKPVAQVIQKYRNDNPDGSITWGFENDDGTFKEETIGIDCVTTGKYGYIDPDGVRREYTYTSGIPCDKANQDSEAGATNNEGYIDYENNKYVLPNGQEVDLDNMVKNRARRPTQYRN